MLCSLGAYIRTCTRPRYPLELVSTHTPCQKRHGKKKEERKRKGPPLLSPPLLLGASCLRQPVRKISLRSSGENEPYALPSEKNSAWCRAQGVDARMANPIDLATSTTPHAPHLLATLACQSPLARWRAYHAALGRPPLAPFNRPRRGAPRKCARRWETPTEASGSSPSSEAVSFVYCCRHYGTRPAIRNAARCFQATGWAPYDAHICTCCSSPIAAIVTVSLDLKNSGEVI